MLLTVGMATYDDYEGVWGTLVPLRDAIVAAGLVDDVELIVVDNNPDGLHAPHVRHVTNGIGRYVPDDGPPSTSRPRDRIFQEARGEWTLVIDSHVYLRRGVLERLVRFCRAPGSRADDQALWHGPLLHESIAQADGAPALVWTHWAPVWGADGMLGQMRCEPHLAEDSPAHQIAASGMGLFLSRTREWLGFHLEHRGFGGEEVVIHQRYRDQGRRVYLLPWLQWVHRFRPADLQPPYPMVPADRCRNYLLTARDWGHPTVASVKRAYVEEGRITVAEWAELLAELGMTEGQTPEPPVAIAPPPVGTTQLADLADEEASARAMLPCGARGEVAGLVRCEDCGSAGKLAGLYACTHRRALVSLQPRNSRVAACSDCVLAGEHEPMGVNPRLHEESA